MPFPPFAWLVLSAALALATAVAAAEAPRRIAFLGVTFLNTSLQETTPDEVRRLAELEARLHEALALSGRYAFVDTAPVTEKAARHLNLAQCNGCDARLAAELDADYALTGLVQKTSNLILSVSIFLRDAKTGALVGGGSADIRGNTDEDWARGIHYILRNRLLGS